VYLDRPEPTAEETLVHRKRTIHDALGPLAADDHAAVLTDQADDDAYSWCKRPLPRLLAWRSEPRTAAVSTGGFADRHSWPPMLHRERLIGGRDAACRWFDQTAPTAGPLDHHAAIIPQRPGAIGYLIDVVKSHSRGGEGWWCEKASTLAELEAAFAAINQHSGAAYLEVMIPAVESQPLAEDVIEMMHQTQTPKKRSE